MVSFPFEMHGAGEIRVEALPEEARKIDGEWWFSSAVVERALHLGEATATEATAMSLDAILHSFDEIPDLGKFIKVLRAPAKKVREHAGPARA